MKILLKRPLDSDLVKCGFRPGQVIDALILGSNKSAYFSSSYNGIPQNCVVGRQYYELLETTRPALDPDFYEIECPPNGFDFRIFSQVVDMGIDSHLEAFQKSKFGYRYYDSIGLRAYFNFHLSEREILLRRMKTLRPQFVGDYLDDLITDISLNMTPIPLK
jgi:hypothetical protein